MHKIIFILFFNFIVFSLFSQENIDMLINDIINNTSDEDVSYDNFNEVLDGYSETPLNLNYATKEELESLNILNDIQIKNLLYYREKRGYFLTIYELIYINGFNDETVNQIKPYVICEKIEKFNNNYTKYGKLEFINKTSFVLQKQEGYNTNFVGNKISNTTKIKYYKQNKFSYSLNFDKDAGEKFICNKKPEFLSGHFFIKKINKTINSIVLGNYNLQFGQGLTLSTGYGVSSFSSPSNIAKFETQIKPNSSVAEDNYLSGAASNIKINSFNITPFFSYRLKDAKIETIDGTKVFYSFINNGYHNTQETIDDKNKLKEQIYGINASFNKNYLHLGSTFYTVLFNAYHLPQNKLYDKFDIEGNNCSNFGIDYKWLFKNTLFFGELSFDNKFNYATIHGISFYLNNNFNMSLLYRNYDKKYNNLYNSAYSTNTNTKDEEGFYFGLNTIIFKDINLNAYYNISNSSWFKYLIDGPSFNNKYLVQCTYKSYDYNLLFQINANNTIKTQTAIDLINNDLYFKNKTNYKFRFSYTINKITLKSSLESLIIKTNEEKTRGYMAYEDIIYDLEKIKIYLRYGLFNTDSYDERIYTYENDLLYSFSMPSFYDIGHRYYIMLKYKIAEKINLWVKYSSTIYINKSSISSGDNLINGNTKSEIKIQLRFVF